MGYVLATVARAALVRSRARTRSATPYDADGQALDGDITDRPALFIALANSRQYGNGAQIAPKALLDDGMMEIVDRRAAVERCRSRGSCRRFSAARLQEGPGIVMRSAASMEISCAQPIAFHVDGEPRTGPNRIRMQTRRGVLLVKVSR